MVLATKISGQDVYITVEGSPDSAANIGVDGVGLFKQKNGAIFEFKKLQASSGKLTVVADGNGDNVDLDLATVLVADITGLQSALDAKSNTGHGHVAADVSDFNTQVRTSRLDQMAVPSADVSINSHKLTNLTDPTSAQDAATKAYVDANAQGLDVKAAVRVATTANGTLASAFENGDTVDGVVLATNDRILIKNQTTASENGIYTVNASGAPTRATDADQDAEVTSGMYAFVSEGTVNAGTGYILTTPDPIVVGTTGLTFSQFSGGGTIQAGTGLAKTGNVLSTNDSQIVHQSLSGHGTNTHAQIDTHIADTANPHATTKTQVGLGNVDNTSDANKPVSTAQQTALNLKSNTGHVHTTTEVTALAEYIQDTVAAMLTQGTNVTLVYDDVLATLSISAAAGGGGGGVYEALLAGVNSIQVWKDAATSTYTGDGSADEVQANARLAVNDNRIIKLAPGRLTTAAAVVFVDNVKHNLRGDQTDASIIEAAHNGNILEIHSAGLPQEYRTSIDDLALDRSGASTPARGVSAINAALLHLKRVRIRHCVDGVYGYFFNTGALEDMEISQCTNAIHITGANGQASHFCTAKRVNSRDNRTGFRFTTQAQQWKLEQCGIYGYAAGDVGSLYEAGAAEMDSHEYDQCWWENGVGGNLLWYPFDVRQPIHIILNQPRIGITGGAKFINPATLHPGALIEINWPIVSNFSAIDDLPPNVVVRTRRTFYNNGLRDIWGALNRHEGQRNDVHRLPTVSGRSASYASLATPAWGIGQGDKNLITSVNLTDTAAWSSDAGALPTAGVTDPNGGTTAYSLADGAVKKHTMTNANGGSALAGAVFSGIIGVKGPLGAKLIIRFNDVVTGATYETTDHVQQKENVWEVVPFKVDCPAEWTGTSLRIRLQAAGGAISVWNPTIALGLRTPPFLTPSRDMSAIANPFTVVGPAKNIRSYATAIPVSGTFLAGDYLENTNPTANGIMGWHCAVAGTPGQWFPVMLSTEPVVNIDRFGAKGDDATNDISAWNAAKAAINAIGGGSIDFSPRTYRFASQGTTQVDDPASVTDFQYAIRIDENDADITVRLQPGAVIKRASGEPENSTLILIGGKSTNRRLKRTALIGYGTVDGNYAGNNTINGGHGFTDGGELCAIYNDNLIIDGWSFRETAGGGGLHIMRGSGKTRLSRLFFDLIATIPSGFGNGARLETNDIELTDSTFVCDAVNGKSLLQYSDNADILFETRGGRVHGCLFMGGFNGAIVDLGGISHMTVTQCMFRDVCHSSGIALSIDPYSNQNGSIFPSVGCIVADCVFHNIRTGINIVSNAAVMLGVNWSTGGVMCDIHDCIFTKDLDLIRNKIVGPATAYPAIPPPYEITTGAGSGQRGTRAPNAVTVNFIVGVQVGFVSKRTGVTTGAGSAFVDDANPGLTGPITALTTDVVKNWFIYLTVAGINYKALITTNTATRISFAALPVTVPVGTAYTIGDIGTPGIKIHDCIFFLSNATGKAVNVLSPSDDIEVYNNKAYNVSVTPTTVVAFTLMPQTKRWRNKGWSGDPFGNTRMVFADEGTGNVTMTSVATTAVVTHNLGRNPGLEEISFRWASNPSGASQPYVTNITGNNQFTVNCATAPSVDTVLKWAVAPAA